MIHHRELALALAQGGAAPYLARVLRVIAHFLAIEGALLVRLEGRQMEIVASSGLPLHAVRGVELDEAGYRLVKGGCRIANAHRDPQVMSRPFIGSAPHWRSVVVLPVASPSPGTELRFIGGSADPQPPAVKTLASDLFHDLVRILAEEMKLIFDVAVAVSEPAFAPGELNHVAEPQLPFVGPSTPCECHDEVVVRFLTDTLLVKHRVLSRRGIAYHGLRTWRKPIKAEQLAALKALKSFGSTLLDEYIVGEVVGWIGSAFGAKRFSAIVPVPCGHSGADCLSCRAARALGARLDLPVIAAFEPLRVTGSSHPRTNSRRPRMRLRQEVSGDILLFDDVATSGAHIGEATALLRSQDNSVTAVAWIADQ